MAGALEACNRDVRKAGRFVDASLHHLTILHCALVLLMIQVLLDEFVEWWRQKNV